MKEGARRGALLLPYLLLLCLWIRVEGGLVFAAESGSPSPSPTVGPNGASTPDIIAQNRNRHRPTDFSFPSVSITEGEVFGNAPQNVVLDSSGNALVTGTFRGRLEWQTINGTYFSIASGGYAAFFVKYSASQPRQVEWVAQVENLTPDTRSYASSIIVDSKDDVIMAGQFIGDVKIGDIVLLGELHANNIYIVKINRQGNLVWGISMTGTAINVCNGLAVDFKTDDIYAAGYYGKKLVIAESAVLDSNYLNFYVAKFNSSNSLQWVRSGNASSVNGDGATVFTNDIDIDAAGNPVMIGTFTGTLYFRHGIEGVTRVHSPLVDEESVSGGGFGQTVLQSEGVQSVFIVQFDKMGRFNWATGIGGPAAVICGHNHYLYIDREHDRVYVAGCFNGTVNFFENPDNMTSATTPATTTTASHNTLTTGRKPWVRSGHFPPQAEESVLPIVKCEDTAECMVRAGGGMAETASLKKWRETMNPLQEREKNANANEKAEEESRNSHVDDLEEWSPYPIVKSARQEREKNANAKSAKAEEEKEEEKGHAASSEKVKRGNGTNVAVVLNNTEGVAMYLAQYNVQGLLQWARKVSVQEGKYGAALAVDTLGAAYIMGYFEDNATFSSPDGSLISILQKQGSYMAKYDANGTVIWATFINAMMDIGGMMVDNSFNVVGFGAFRGLAAMGRNFSLISHYDSYYLFTMADQALPDIVLTKPWWANSTVWIASTIGMGGLILLFVLLVYLSTLRSSYYRFWRVHIVRENSTRSLGQPIFTFTEEGGEGEEGGEKDAIESYQGIGASPSRLSSSPINGIERGSFIHG